MALPILRGVRFGRSGFLPLNLVGDLLDLRFGAGFLARRRFIFVGIQVHIGEGRHTIAASRSDIAFELVTLGDRGGSLFRGPRVRPLVLGILFDHRGRTGFAFRGCLRRFRVLFRFESRSRLLAPDLWRIPQVVRLIPRRSALRFRCGLRLVRDFDLVVGFVQIPPARPRERRHRPHDNLRRRIVVEDRASDVVFHLGTAIQVGNQIARVLIAVLRLFGHHPIEDRHNGFGNLVVLQTRIGARLLRVGPQLVRERPLGNGGSPVSKKYHVQPSE